MAFDLSLTNHALSTDDSPLLHNLLTIMDVDWGRINQAHPLAVFLHPAVPLIGVVFYFLSMPLFDVIRNTLQVNRNSSMLKILIALHNIVLAVFSGLSSKSNRLHYIILVLSTQPYHTECVDPPPPPHTHPPVFVQMICRLGCVLHGSDADCKVAN
jgi:hypothetical protein